MSADAYLAVLYRKPPARWFGLYRPADQPIVCAVGATRADALDLLGKAWIEREGNKGVERGWQASQYDGTVYRWERLLAGEADGCLMFRVIKTDPFNGPTGSFWFDDAR